MRFRATVASSILVALLAACTGQSKALPVGDAFGSATPNRETLVMHKIFKNRVLFVPLPSFVSGLRDNVHLLSARYLSVPATFRVVQYRAYSFDEVGKAILGWSAGVDNPELDPRHFTAYPLSVVTLRPRHGPYYFGLVEVVPLKKGKFTIKNCRFVYEIHGEKYQEISNEVTTTVEVTR